ncbi:hypothetical protein Ccrd_025734 [Cynara cardunculus var. scolymus]|uniref:F-box domain-containing protein n=1 Tax=Cynara cardunculus var. scolymus TaxID=59895 RepID=A0A103V0P0_CYNCS|nr:hypothetical protein Ccrd_025734 [Cynara cardunculus var. scolymus]
MEWSFVLRNGVEFRLKSRSSPPSACYSRNGDISLEVSDISIHFSVETNGFCAGSEFNGEKDGENHQLAVVKGEVGLGLQAELCKNQAVNPHGSSLAGFHMKEKDEDLQMLSGSLKNMQVIFSHVDGTHDGLGEGLCPMDITLGIHMLSIEIKECPVNTLKGVSFKPCDNGLGGNILEGNEDMGGITSTPTFNLEPATAVMLHSISAQSQVDQPPAGFEGAVEILISAQKVCTTWRKICKDPPMWKVIDLHQSFEFDAWDVDHDIDNLARQAVLRSCWELIDISIGCFGTDDLFEYISRW